MIKDKNISYLNKDFNDFKNTLTNYAKTYFPNSYNDFTESSIGNMFIEMSSYVGDVLSFYLDNQFQENLFLYTKEKTNIMDMAYTLGYRPKNSYASTVDVDLYQLLPISSSNGGVTQSPDYTYSLIIPENTVLKSSSTGQKFLLTSPVDFSDIGSAELSFFNNTYYLIKKTAKAISGELKSTTFNFGNPQKFASVTLNDTNILQILNVTGSDSSIWYEVPYLAQDTILQKTSNSNVNSDSVSYLLSLQKVPKRFVSRFQSDGSLKIEFGAGISSQDDSTILPNPDNVQLGLVSSISNNLSNFNKTTPYFTKEYGVAPSNIDLYVQYLVGGGISSNVPTNDISQFDSSFTTSNFKQSRSDGGIYDSVVLSNVTVNNSSPAVGGRGGDTVDEIRLNTLHAFAAQNRAVTKEDYAMRVLSMPSEYGNIAKAYIVQDSIISKQSGNDSLIDNNPLSLSAYILAYDSNKKLTEASSTLKNNLKTYLNQYRIVTDSITIKNAYYINIGINFNITTLSGYNNNEVISKCIKALQDYFSIDKWQINQPIILSDVYSTLLKVKGVLSVINVEIVNKQSNDGTYSQYGYDIAGATRNGIIYPSVDPAVFELRWPNIDIYGAVRGF